MPDRLLVTVGDARAFGRDQIAALDADDDFAALCLGAAQDCLADWLGYDPVAHPASAPVHADGSASFVGPATPLGGPSRPTTGAPPAQAYVSGWRPDGEDDAALLSALGSPAGVAEADVSAVPPAPSAVRSALAEAAVVLARRYEENGGAGAQGEVVVGETGVAEAPSNRLSDVNLLIGRTTEVEAVFASRLVRYRHLTI